MTSIVDGEQLWGVTLPAKVEVELEQQYDDGEFDDDPIADQIETVLTSRRQFIGESKSVTVEGQNLTGIPDEHEYVCCEFVYTPGEDNVRRAIARTYTYNESGERIQRTIGAVAGVTITEENLPQSALSE